MSFSDFRRKHPAFTAAVAVIIVGLLAIDAWVIYKRVAYEHEVERLRAGMSDVERRRSDAVTNTNEKRLAMMMELLRRQAKIDKEIHLAVAVDSSKMYLERDGALLREMSVEVAAGKRLGSGKDTVHMAAPRGTRTVEKILGPSDAWEVPAWVYADRGVPQPASASLVGALGPVAIVLNGGTVIYSLPTAGPLNDSSYVLPGSIRVSAEDLRAVAPNLQRGTVVYFY
ncbi:MAG: L,D-transpeptidase [Gemmatimonadaceae bacterium]